MVTKLPCAFLKNSKKKLNFSKLDKLANLPNNFCTFLRISLYEVFRNYEPTNQEFPLILVRETIERNVRLFNLSTKYCEMKVWAHLHAF
jgi:hypothetical protein